MYKIFITFSFVLICFKTVTSHGGHNEGLQTKNAIQDALLSYLCRAGNGLPCNGHGSCSLGKCMCFRGYSGIKCEINDVDIGSFGHVDDTSGTDNNVGGLDLHDLIPHVTEPVQIVACFTNDQNACSGNGFCHEGSCLCQAGYSGLTCELSQEKGFCETYRECAECMALLIDCPEKCSLMAKFKLVFGFPKVTDADDFRKCRIKNSERNCTFYFKQESQSAQGMKTIAVKACLYFDDATTSGNDTVDQLKDKPLQPVTSLPLTTSLVTTAPTDDQSNTGEDMHDTHPHGDHAHGAIDEAGKQDSRKGDSGTNFAKPEMFLVFGSILMLLL